MKGQDKKGKKEIKMFRPRKFIKPVVLIAKKKVGKFKISRRLKMKKYSSKQSFKKSDMLNHIHSKQNHKHEFNHNYFPSKGGKSN